LIERLQFERMVRGGGVALAALVVCAGLAGCRHKTRPLALPQAASAPIELEPIPPPEPPPMIASLPPPQLGPLPTPPPERPARRRRAAPTPAKETAPTQVASAAEPAAVAIGALSTGGDASAQSQQQARDLIASIVKRISALPAKAADAEKRQIRQVKQFLDQAQQALGSGDAEGANNLATKAKLLMDDVEKQ
jgi:hypothetical protein